MTSREPEIEGARFASGMERTHICGEPGIDIASAHPPEPPLLLVLETAPTTTSAVAFGFAVFHDWRCCARVALIAAQFSSVPHHLPSEFSSERMSRTLGLIV